MLVCTQRIRVEWSNCDPAGIIFNPHYYAWMDQGTHALLQAAGFDFIEHANSDKDFLGCPLVASNMDFKKPLRFGDVTTMVSSVSKFGNKSFVISHGFLRDGDPVASGSEVRVWAVRGDGDKPIVAVVMPEFVKEGLCSARRVDMSV